MYANAHNLPFLATSGKHGDAATLKHIRNGIQIELEQLNQVSVSATRDQATIGGGAKVKGILDGLAAQGKRTVTGVCECVGIGGLMLGGGLGFLQGQYGLMVDQLISARLVLANGTIVNVSEESNPDLLWALKGAGHNFGVVTELSVKTYELKGHEKWAYEIFRFKGEQLEDFFNAVNTLSHAQPAQLTGLGLLRKDAQVDSVDVSVYRNCLIPKANVSRPRFIGQ